MAVHFAFIIIVIKMTFTAHFLVILIISIRTIHCDKPRAMFDIQFKPELQMLTNRATVDTLFTSTPLDVSHSLTTVSWCADIQSFLIGSSFYPCARDAYRWTHLMNRLYDYNNKEGFRGAIMIFDVDTCEKILSKTRFINVLKRYNVNGALLAMRLVKGPYSYQDTIKKTACLSNKTIHSNQGGILMFDEQALPENEQNLGYSEEQLKEIFTYKSKNPDDVVDIIALDTLYLCATPVEVMQKTMKRVALVALYQIEGQELPDMILLNKVYYIIQRLVGDVLYFFDYRLFHATRTQFPRNLWHWSSHLQAPQQMLNPSIFHKYLGGYPVTKLTVYTVNKNAHQLNDKVDDTALRLDLNRLLPYVHSIR